MEEFNENERHWNFCFKFTQSVDRGKRLLDKNGFYSFEDVKKLYEEQEKRRTTRNTQEKESVIINGQIIKCKHCNSTNIKQISAQVRSIDEGETQYIYCNSCTSRYVMD